MKKIIILTVAFILSASFIKAQEQKQDTVMKLSFAQFEEWMKTLSPAGYPFTETGRNGAEYMATFMNKETFKMIGITMSPMKNFEDYKKLKVKTEEFTRNGLRHVYYGLENFWNLSVELKSLNACVQVTTVYINMSKDELIKIFDDSGLYKKTP